MYVSGGTGGERLESVYNNIRYVWADNLLVLYIKIYFPKTDALSVARESSVEYRLSK